MAFVVLLSNYLVQFPINYFGLKDLSDMPKHNEISEIVNSDEDKINSETI